MSLENKYAALISAAKNATVALIPATVLADGVVTIFGVPNITDVDALSQLLREAVDKTYKVCNINK